MYTQSQTVEERSMIMQYTKAGLEESLAYWLNIRWVTKNQEVRQAAHQKVAEIRAELKAAREEADCQAEHDAWERANNERNWLASLGDK